MEQQPISHESKIDHQKTIEDSVPDTLRKIIAFKLKNELHIVDSANSTIAESTLKPQRVLGQGFTALVLSGVSPDHGPVALKAYFQAAVGEKATFQKILSDEASALQDLDHPNIAKSFGLGEIRVTEKTVVPVIIRELIPHTLKELMTNKRKLNTAEVVTMVEQLSGALDYLYSKKNAIITDLTPENLGQRDDHSWVIMDLGNLARVDSDNIVLIDSKYSAPEVLSVSELKRNQLATSKSEVFSLGLIAWTCLSGKEINQDARTFNPQNIITSEGIPDSVFQVLQKAVSEDPDQRYSSPTEFSQALKSSAEEDYSI